MLGPKSLIVTKNNFFHAKERKHSSLYLLLLVNRYILCRQFKSQPDDNYLDRSTYKTNIISAKHGEAKTTNELTDRICRTELHLLSGMSVCR
jgi:hypothetical protein